MNSYVRYVQYVRYMRDVRYVRYVRYGTVWEQRNWQKQIDARTNGRQTVRQCELLSYLYAHPETSTRDNLFETKKKLPRS